MKFLTFSKLLQEKKTKPPKASRVTSSWALPLHPPILPLFLLLKLVFFFISCYEFSYCGAESASCFACEKSIAITREMGRERRMKRGRRERREGDGSEERDGLHPRQADPV